MKPKPKADAVIRWLLEEDQPAIRYLTLTQLLGKPADDPEVEAAREQITKSGWAADLLATQKCGGWWGDGAKLYRPKYTSTQAWAWNARTS